jgi:hypothetical protein
VIYPQIIRNPDSFLFPRIVLKIDIITHK